MFYVYSTLRSVLYSTLRSVLYNTLRSALYSTLRSALYSTLSSVLYSTLRSAFLHFFIDSALPNGILSLVSMPVKTTLLEKPF